MRDLLLHLNLTPFFSYGWSPNIHLHVPDSYHKPCYQPKGHILSGRGTEMMENCWSTLNYPKLFIKFLGRANTPLASPPEWSLARRSNHLHWAPTKILGLNGDKSGILSWGPAQGLLHKKALFTDSALSLNTWRIHLGCKGKASGENIIWWLEHEMKDRIWPKLPEAKLLLGRNMCFYGI